MSETLELKPCPFCGAIANEKDQWGHLITHYPNCYWTNVHGDPIGRVRVNYSEVEQWNRRTLDAQRTPAKRKERPYNSALADVMLCEGDFAGLAEEVGRPNAPASAGTEEEIAREAAKDIQAQWSLSFISEAKVTRIILAALRRSRAQPK